MGPGRGGDSSGMNRSIPINKIMDDCMIAWAMNGEALRPEQGYPARLVVPGWEGNMWVKWIRRVEFGDMPYMSREETSKYTRLNDRRHSTHVYLGHGCQIGYHLA